MPLSIGESVVVTTADGHVGYTGEVIGFEPGYYFDQPPAVLIAPDDERLEIPMKAPYHSVVTASEYMIPDD